MNTNTSTALAIPHVRQVERLNVSGGRYVDITTDIGHHSWRMPDGLDEVRALHQMADECQATAERSARRAAILRRAAFIVADSVTRNAVSQY